MKTTRNIKTSCKVISNHINHLADDIMRYKIIPYMRDSEILDLIRYDELLIHYGNKMCQKYRSSHHYPMIRARLRLAGKFLLTGKNIDSSIKNFSSFIHPTYFDTTVKAINILGGLDVC